MISFTGYEELIKKVYDNGQDHIFEYWESLDAKGKTALLADVSEVDFNVIKNLFTKNIGVPGLDYTGSPFIPIPATAAEKSDYEYARHAGIEHIKKGKVAAFVVAGGQGSRLGYEGPKGMFPVGPISGKTLFAIFGEKILAYSKKYGVTIPWLIMTSRLNHHETVSYLEKNSCFGLDRKDVLIFPQNLVPSLDTDGKLILETVSAIFKNPDGHGGSLTALATSGALDTLMKRGIDTLSYFQVDNPLVKIIDPVFIGYHVKKNGDISSKGVKKVSPEEKMGVFVKFSNGNTGIVEYSDLPPEKMYAKDERGCMKFGLGSVAIHLFSIDFINRITRGDEISLPFHAARKKIRAYKGGRYMEIDGFKFEKFVFDALALTGRNIVFETAREEEFAPVKNAAGVDSVESARKLMSDLHRKWLISRGIKLPDKDALFEISPLFAVEEDDIGTSIKIPESDRVFLE